MDYEERLLQLRKSIDAANLEILRWLECRRSIQKQIIQLKKENKQSLYDPEREMYLLESLSQQCNTSILSSEDVKAIFLYIIDYFRFKE